MDRPHGNEVMSVGLGLESYSRYRALFIVVIGPGEVPT